jgi:hypothetical protein
MRVVHVAANEFVLEMSPREKSLFLGVLQRYPLIPVSHHRLTRTPHPKVNADDQQLLEEAMSGQKRVLQGRAGDLIRSKDRFVLQGRSWRIAFTREDLEWLLQVLNDVRVGSWLLLGCPDPDEGKAPVITTSNGRHVLLMELSGYFESLVLEALDGGKGA